MKLIASVISAVITLTASLAGIIVLMLVAHVTIDVVMRFAFDTPLNSTILYVSAFYMVAIAFLPLAAVEQNTFTKCVVQIYKWCMAHFWNCCFVR